MFVIAGVLVVEKKPTKKSIVSDHSLNMYAKFSEKLTYHTP